jgi:hypothetical protein
MSNYLAVATVTEAIRQILTEALRDLPDLQGAEVFTVRPEAMAHKQNFLGANLYLYQVGPNSAFRNNDLVTRRQDGTLVQRPQVALDLNYLLTFYGQDQLLEPQRLLGCAVSALHAQPVLTRDTIKRAVSTYSWLANSDLADQIESVRLTPLYMDLEELSKLWTVFFQSAHTLSVFYQGSVVLINSDLIPHAALPVSQSSHYVGPFQQPVISVRPQDGTDSAIVAGTTLLVSGQQLDDETTRVFIGGAAVPVQNVNQSGTQLSVTIPTERQRRARADKIRAGMVGLQVVQQKQIGDPPKPRPIESNVVPLMLRPTVLNVRSSMPETEPGELRSATLHIKVDPPVGATQRVALLLNEFQTSPVRSPESYRFEVPILTEDSDQISLSVDGVKPATYLVRVQVDSAESMLILGDDRRRPPHERYIGPKVVIK